GEQHPRGGQDGGAARARDALAARRPLRDRPGGGPGPLLHAHPVHALRERALRARLPRRGDRAQRRGAERHGLQPLRRHALLLEQLPLQGATLQLLPVRGLGDAEPEAPSEPGRDRARPGRDGEVHLLRVTHHGRSHRRGKGGPADPRRRDRDRLPGGVPDRGDRLRQHQRPDEPRRAPESRRAQLRAPRGAQHPPPDDVPRGGPQPQPGARLSVPESAEITPRAPSGPPPVIEPGHTFATITDKISTIVLTRRTPRGWFLGFAIAFAVMMMLFYAIAYLLIAGIGIWGINIPVGWGFAIINFVWWIGIGHAGTLISAILLLLRQQWRQSINRFAEAMTL